MQVMNSTAFGQIEMRADRVPGTLLETIETWKQYRLENKPALQTILELISKRAPSFLSAKQFCQLKGMGV